MTISDRCSRGLARLFESIESTFCSLLCRLMFRLRRLPDSAKGPTAMFV